MDKIEEAIRNSLEDGQLPCAAAFALAKSLGVDSLQVGQAADRLGVRLSKCQLGLFGYGSKAEGKHRRVKPLADVPHQLADAIRAALDSDGKLSCAKAWKIAEEGHFPRQFVSDAVEGMGLRISMCQLGAF